MSYRWRGWGPPAGRRPPWWPEGEPFPPVRRWGRRPPPFIRLLGCLVVSAFLLLLFVGALVGAALGRRPDVGPLLLFLILVIGIAVAVSGGMRRLTRPMESLISAARRIESGDYSAQVPEWGSSDIRSVARAFNSMSARLKAMDDQRRSFLADVTHELRTPLSVIRGQAEAIADGVYPADSAHLAPILDATQTLDRLVEDLRTLVLTDAGSLVLHKEPTDVGALVHDAAESFRAQAESKELSLTTDIATSLPTLEIDPSRIRQVIGNLLSNAIRHTPSGGSVKVAVAPTSDEVTITVSDTGEGISPDLSPHVFDRFVKGPNSTGSGLGLAIARDIVTAHRGRIAIESVPGKGTSVRLALPPAGAASQ